MSLNIRLTPKLEIKLRITVLHDVVSELAAACNATDEFQRLIHECIVEKQVCKCIAFLFLNAEKLVIARLTLTIDWETHRLRASSDDGKFIEIDSQIPVSEQVGAMVKVVRDLILEIKRNVPDVQMEWNMSVVDSIGSNSRVAQEMRRKSGVRPAVKRRWAPDAEFKPDWVIGGATSNMPELDIRLEMKKPKGKEP